MYATGLDRLQVLAVAAAVRFGAAELLPGQLRITGSSGDIVDYLSKALGQRCYVCIYIGPPRAVQKPVLQILSGTGQTLGFAKIGVDDTSRHLVRRETQNLRFLSTANLRTVTVPAVMHSGQWAGHEVLAQQALLRTGRGYVDGSTLEAAMYEIAHAEGTASRALERSSYWSRLHQRIEDLPRSPLGELIRAVRDEVGATSGSVSVPFGCWHGDWGPWNMTQSEGRLLVWDWEHFEHDVPLGFDAIHHQVQSAVLSGSAPESAFVDARCAAQRLLSPFGRVEPALAQVIVQLYTLEISTRYLSDGEPDRDGTIMGRLDWLKSTWPLLRVHAPCSGG